MESIQVYSKCQSISNMVRSNHANHICADGKMMIKDESYMTRKTDKILKSISKLKSQLEKPRYAEHTFSLPSLNKDQESRLESINKSSYITQNRNRLRFLISYIKFSMKVTQSKDSELARCSAVMLSKHVTSLDRKASIQRVGLSYLTNQPSKESLMKDMNIVRVNM